MVDPASVASQRSIYALGLGLLAFLTLMCTACNVLAGRQATEVQQPSVTPREALDEPSRPSTAICAESPDLVPVWPEGEISGICAGTEGLAQDGPWRRDGRGTALQFARAVLSWPGAEVASADAGTGSRMIFEVRQSPTQRVQVVVKELVSGIWSVIDVDAVPERGGLSLLVSGTQVTAEASPPEGAASTEVKTVGYRGSQASASSTGGRIALGVPVGSSGRAPGWLLVLAKDANGHVLTAEAVQVPEGTADFRIP